MVGESIVGSVFAAFDHVGEAPAKAPGEQAVQQGIHGAAQIIPNACKNEAKAIRDCLIEHVESGKSDNGKALVLFFLAKVEKMMIHLNLDIIGEALSKPPGEQDSLSCSNKSRCLENGSKND